MPKLAHRAQFFALRSLVNGLRLLGWNRAVSLGETIGTLGYKPLGVRRNTVEKQVAAAFPGLDGKEVARISRGAYASLGRTTIEMALLATRGPLGVLELFEPDESWAVYERALAKGRGVIFVTGHLGNWELGAAYLAARGVPLDVIVRRMSNPLFDEYLTGTRAHFGMVVVPDSDAVRRTPRSLREGRSVAFVSDQGVKGLASTFVPFFGRPAKTPRGPAVLALRLGVPVVFAAVVRQPNLKYRMILEPVEVIETGDRERDVDDIVARFTKQLERHVRAVPEQYFWHHRRWRRQPKDTPPELREPA